MRPLRFLMRNLTVLNIVLLAAIAVGATYVFSPLISLNGKYTPHPPKKTEGITEGPPASSQAPSPLDYTVVAEQNLFHPERKIPVDKPLAAPLPKPEFVLYGVLITNDTSVAYIEDKKAPQSTTGRGKRQSALRKGENLSGFTLTDIAADKIVMVRGDESVTVNLSDQPKSREGGAPPAQPTQPLQQAVTHQPVPGQPAGTPPPMTAQPSVAPPPQRTTTVLPAQQLPTQQLPAQQPTAPFGQGEGTSQDARKSFLDFFKRKSN